MTATKKRHVTCSQGDTCFVCGTKVCRFCAGFRTGSDHQEMLACQEHTGAEVRAWREGLNAR